MSSLYRHTKIVDGHNPASLTFSITGSDGPHTATATIDRVTGLATATVATPFVSAGSKPVVVSSSDDGFLKPTTSTANIIFKGATTTTYTGDTDAFWSDSFDVSALTVDAISGDPVTHGSVIFTRGSSVSPAIPVVDGIAATTLTASDNPSPGQTVKAVYKDDPDPEINLFNDSQAEVAFTTKPRPTDLSYTGDLVGTYNSQATLSAKLLDQATQAPLEGMTVVFKVGDDEADTAITDENGIATKVIDVASDVGELPLDIDFFGTVRYVADHVDAVFTTDFQYKFTDTLIGNGGSVLLNPSTQQIGAENADGDRTGIKEGYQLSLYLPTIVGYPDELPSVELPQEWNILNLPRLSDLFGIVAHPPAVGTPPTVPAPTVPEAPAVPELPIPELPIPMLPASSGAAWPVARPT